MYSSTQSSPLPRCSYAPTRNGPRRRIDHFRDTRRSQSQCNLRIQCNRCRNGRSRTTSPVFLIPSPAASSERVVCSPPCTINATKVAPDSIVTLNTIRNKHVPSIRIPVRIQCNGGQIDARALLDSGAEGVYCNVKFVKQNSLPLKTLQTPILPRNVDGSINTQGMIRHATLLRMGLGTHHAETTEFCVTDIGEHDILLGTDWLQTHNPSIDWTKNVISMNRCPTECFQNTPSSPILAHLLPICEWEPQLDDTFDVNATVETTPLVAKHLHDYFQTAQIARTTVSTTLAKATQIMHTDVPSEFQKYHKVFSDEEAQRLPRHQPWDHKIDLLPGTQMRKTSIYRLTPPEKITLQDYVTAGLKQGSLRRSKAPNACSFFFIDKKDGKLRPVQDYRPLNDITKKNAAPIPLIPELVDKLLGARFFTKLDVRWGYNNIRLREGDEWKAAFKTPLGLFEPTVMTFGLCNAPATFQTFMDTQFADLIATGHVVIYLDDILIFATTLNELIRLTHLVLQRLQELDLYLRPAKCSFNQTSVEYLGLIISEGELRMDPVKLKAIDEWPLPKTVKDVQKFLGFCNFYRRFVKDYSTIARPLFNLTKQNTAWLWTSECNNAFTRLQHTLTTSPVLVLPDYDRAFTLITDASDYATGAILEQEDAFGRSHPVAYYSKSLQPAKQNYEIHDKELLAIIFALRHFRHYLQGSPHVTKKISDHTNLRYFTTKQSLTRHQARWSLFLVTFSYKIIPKPGKINKADALSRRPDYKEGIASDNADRILLTPDKFRLQALHTTAIPLATDTELKSTIQDAIKSDRLAGQLLKEILVSGPRNITKGLQDWNYENGLIFHKGLIYVPKNDDLKRQITQQFHDNLMGHPGEWKTIELITREYWWPGITEFVKAFVKGCAICQTTKARPPTRVPLHPNEVPKGIWETITMDFITDLPTSLGYDSILTVVDRHSKAVILSPCHKTITAEQTSQLLIDNVWKRTGFPLTIISDRGPQFAAQVTQEFWRKLGIEQKLSTAFHPQTDGESERVNQEIEQYLHIYGNFQQDNWASLLPIVEFAHNARPHRSTHKSPFEIWYGFQPTFKPPMYLQTRLQSVEERTKYLDQVRKEVTAALLLAAQEMRKGGTTTPSHEFHKDDLVLLEATNLQTTHPKAKLAPRRYRPFKVLWASPTNCKLELPPRMKVHPVFHNSLIKPYTETVTHGPNFELPPPEIIEGEEGHYKIEKILMSRPTQNQKSTQYLVKWKGYPDSENSWLPEKELTHAKELLTKFHEPRINNIAGAMGPKEGILSRAICATTQNLGF